MPVSNGVVLGRSNAKSGTVLLARIVDASGAPIVNAGVSGISYLAHDCDAGTSGSNTPVTVGQVLFDTLRTDYGWNQDSTGYNLRIIVPASAFSWIPEIDPIGDPTNRRFQIDVKITPTSGEPFVVVFGVWVNPVWIA
jgi:hypothetical protein